MNWTDVIMLICINGVHVKLLRMGPVNMALWRSCNTFRTATYKQNVLLRTGTLSIQCAVSTILLHKPPECFSKHNWLSDNVQILQNLGSISKSKTPKWWNRRSIVLWAGGPTNITPHHTKFRLPRWSGARDLFSPFLPSGVPSFVYWPWPERRWCAVCLCFYLPRR